MSYIQKQIGGRLRGLKFNTLAIREFLRTVDWERYSSTANYAMVWAGLYGNAYAKREEVDFTMEDVIDWLDAMTQQDMDEISAVMAEVHAFKALLPKAEEPAAETVEEKKSELQPMT